MVYSYKETLKKYKTDYNIKKAVKNKEIFKIESGIYSDKININYLSILNHKYSYGVISGHSAYYYYGLTDVIPPKITLCTHRNSTTIKDDEIKQIRMKNELYSLGITKMIYEGTNIKIYDKERLLIDLARNKNNMGYDLYKEIIKNYRQIAHTLETWKIEKYLECFQDSDRIYDIIMNEVF